MNAPAPQRPVSQRPLSDEQMRAFLRDGFLCVKTSLPPEFHRALYEQARRVIEQEYNPGNNLLPRVPALRAVFEDPAVAGALAGVLGPGFFLQPHRYCHLNAPGAPGQKLHRDGFFTRRHHTRWALAFYFPHDVTEEMGPTAIVPGSQYSHTRPGAPEKLFCVEAGTVAICDFHIWHRGTANASGRRRAMIKFLFARMEEPRAPAWDGGASGWEPEEENGRGPLLRHLWNWHRGARPAGRGGARPIGDLLGALRGECEAAGLEAAYELGAIGEAAVPALVDALVSAPDAEQWHPIHERINDGGFPRFVTANVSYALAAAGRPAAAPLAELAAHPSWAVRASAVETLGDLGLAAADALPAIARAARDESVYVRRHAVEALGTAGQESASGVPALADALADEDVRVRRGAALALARVGPRAAEAVPALERALADEDRYVAGNGAHALRRIGTPAAVEALLDFLAAARWCPVTSRESPY